MPRPGKVDKEVLLDVLIRSRKAIIQNGQIAIPSASVWTEVSEQLQQQMTAKGLYTVVKQNRHNIWEALNFSCQDNDCDSSSNTTSDSDCPSPREKDCQTVELVVPFEEWIKFRPEIVCYKDKFSQSQKREYTVLKPKSWTHIINEVMWTQMKNTCTIVFHRAKVYPTVSTKYMDITGNCKECEAHFEITCDREPANFSPMVLLCRIKNRDSSKHTGHAKRFLSGNMREQIGKELCEGRKEPAVWRRAKASELMDFGDPEPSQLPNLATLRKAKQQRKDRELGDKDPIVSLQSLKHSVPHCGSIRDIGLDKFFCHYWSPSQLHVYKTLSKTSPQRVCFDATGSVVKQLRRPNGSSGHIFLYQGVLTANNCSSVPVVQMLSERHDINAISNWLTEWIRSGAPVPKEAVSDFSLAILGALVKAFTPHLDLKTYINECFQVLTGKPSAKLPPCFIRVDVAHCIKMICQWDCLKNQTYRVKDFFVRSMVNVLQSQNLDHAKRLLKAITVTALSATDGNDSSGAPVESERSQLYLKNQFAQDPIITNQDTEDREIMDLCDDDIQTDLHKWVLAICEESKSQVTIGDRTNAHYLPAILPHIIRLASYLPLWTGIMVPLFNSNSIRASSATVEAEFRNIKHGLFKHENLPVRVDRFVNDHLNDIEGRMRLSYANCKEETTVGSVMVTKDNPESMNSKSAEGKIKTEACTSGETGAVTDSLPSDEEPVENWRDKGRVPPKKRYRTAYLNSCAEWLIAGPSSKRLKVELLRNGSLLDAIQYGKSKISVLNTCAFDALCQCLCCAFCDSSAFKIAVTTNSENQLMQLVNDIVTNGVKKPAYSQRAMLLSTMFETFTLQSGDVQIDAQCNICDVLRKTMRNISSVYLKKHCSSHDCDLSEGMTRETPYVSAAISVSMDYEMVQLETAVEKALQMEYTCLRKIKDRVPEQCAGTVTQSYSTGEIVWIDTCLENDVETSLSSFPSNIVLQGKSFILRAVIAYQKSSTEGGLGHYTAYCMRGSDRWDLYDDLKTKVTVANPKNRITPHAVLYTM